MLGSGPATGQLFLPHVSSSSLPFTLVPKVSECQCGSDRFGDAAAALKLCFPVSAAHLDASHPITLISPETTH